MLVNSNDLCPNIKE
uniref:Uncharacterized protein n=1 Tax=Lepeophtheirus salmonis TaxID=72036 RepID=A0A0K2TD47_LEPSM